MVLFKTALRGFLAFAVVLPQSLAYALPAGESVAAGNATFSKTASVMTINQTSAQAIINYNSFNVGGKEMVQFNQPNAASVTLNRVTGGDPSSILGTIKANGQVFLVNPNGIIFGQTAKIDAAGLTASTLGISDADFLAGNYKFNGGNASLINMGQITAPGGYVALIGAHVLNTGSIEAHLGSVALAAGDAVTLNLDPAGIINVVVNNTSLATGSKTAGIDNLGTIKANGGKVILNAKTLNSVFDQAVNNDGIIEAQTIGIKNGLIEISGNNDLAVGGLITGGTVKVTSAQGHVTHKPGSAVTTNNNDFNGSAVNGTYTFANGVVIDTGTADINVQANEIVLGSPDTSILLYDWAHVSSSRAYRMPQFGYYMIRDGLLVYVPLAVGTDIGKAVGSPLSGSGAIFTDPTLLELYTVVDAGSMFLTYHSDMARNPDNTQHLKILTDGTHGWEDGWKGGDKDYDDLMMTFNTKRMALNGPTFKGNKNFNTPTPLVFDGIDRNLPAYYQILSGNQLRTFDPATPTGLYFYHPLVKADSTALDQIDLSDDVFSFIDDEMKKKDNQ